MGRYGMGMETLTRIRFVGRVEIVQQIRVLCEAFQDSNDFAGAEAGAKEAPVGGCQLLVVLEEIVAGGEAVFPADPVFDQYDFVDALINLAYSTFGHDRGDATLPQVLDDTRAAKLVVVQTRGSEALGKPPVIEVTVVLQLREDVMDVGRVGGAAEKPLAQLADRLCPAGKRLQRVLEQRVAVERPGLAIGIGHCPNATTFWTCACRGLRSLEASRWVRSILILAAAEGERYGQKRSF
jgi:hypothetical protein